MPEERVPRWHPIAALPMIGEAIDGMLDSAEDVVRSLEQARPRPHVLDDDTIGRVREAHGTQLNDLWCGRPSSLPGGGRQARRLSRHGS